MRKLDYILKDFPDPEVEGPQEADLTLVGWGSTYAVLMETMQVLNQQGLTVNLVAPRYLWPFRAEAMRQILTRAKMTLAVEANYAGQLARFIRMETGIAIQHHLHKYDGEPFEPGQVIKRYASTNEIYDCRFTIFD
jgi:2-oxoglutarate ferredoxin oxidoreductase subunit alpha